MSFAKIAKEVINFTFKTTLQEIRSEKHLLFSTFAPKEQIEEMRVFSEKSLFILLTNNIAYCNCFTTCVNVKCYTNAFLSDSSA